MELKQINEEIQKLGDSKGKVSDGYHTFDELYEHRIVLYLALCRLMAFMHLRQHNPVWRSKVHSDGTEWEGWFLLGLHTRKGDQITYHLPMKHWDNTGFAKTLKKVPKFDGHTSDDVLERLMNFVTQKS